jgi:hypothetical protein
MKQFELLQELKYIERYYGTDGGYSCLKRLQDKLKRGEE